MNRALVLLACCLVMLGFAQSVHAQTLLTNEHVDIGIGWTTGGGWDLHIHDEDNDIEYSPSDAILVVLPAAYNFDRPAGAAWDFLGVGTGTRLWRLPATQNPELLYLGIGSESGVGGADKFFDSYNETDPRVNATARWIRLTLKGVVGPGQFSLFTESGGVPTVWMATSDGIQAPIPGNGGDSAYVIEDGHNHYFWAFTAPGDYAVTFEASGLLSGVRDFSGDVTYTFRVQAVPEPGSLALVGAGLGAMVRRRRQAKANAAKVPEIAVDPAAAPGREPGFFVIKRRRS